MLKIINYSLIATIILVPIGTSTYMLNKKYEEFNKNINNIVFQVNQTGYANATLDINRGFFNTNGTIQINLSKRSPSKIDINFNARHGIETIFGSPIVLQTDGKVFGSKIKTNNNSLFNTKTKFYPFYSETDYNIQDLEIKDGNKTYLVNNLSGNFKYTIQSKKIQNSSKIDNIILKDNEKLLRVFSGIYIEKDITLDNIFANTMFTKVEVIKTPFNTFNNFFINYDAEVSNKDKNLANIRFKIHSGINNDTIGKSYFSNKFTLYSFPLNNFNGIISEILNAEINQDENSKNNIASIMVKSINEGFEFENQNEMTTEKVGNFGLTINAYIDKFKSQNDSIGDNLKLKGILNHNGSYVNYMYDLTEKLNIAVFKRKENMFSLDFSYQNNKAMINSTEIDASKYLKSIFEIISQI